ncbi:MAG TPA: DUF998 domain-containing protein, partial [Burkholderiales bacterium]
EDEMQSPADNRSYLARSFLIQRRGMALLGAAFPAAFLVSSLILGRTEFQTSISMYYWTLDPERNLFVGVLCAVAVFLILYKGRSNFEDWLLDAAGFSAAGLAFFPIHRTGDCSGPSVSAHGVFAVVFFACIFVVCIFMSEHTLREIRDENRRKRFRTLYRVCSGVMIGSVALAIISRFFSADFVRSLCVHRAAFWFEAVGVWAFSAFWYIKTRELDSTMSWVPFRRKREA